MIRGQHDDGALIESGVVEGIEQNLYFGIIRHQRLIVTRWAVLVSCAFEAATERYKSMCEVDEMALVCRLRR